MRAHRVAPPAEQLWVWLLEGGESVAPSSTAPTLSLPLQEIEAATCLYRGRLCNPQAKAAPFQEDRNLNQLQIHVLLIRFHQPHT